MSDSSQKQDVGDVEASAAQIAQARRDANLIQNSPNATIDNRRSLFAWGARQPKTIDWAVATKLLERHASDVDNRLEQMLFGIAEVGLTPSPQEVAKLVATKILTIDEANPEIIDPISPILEVYDRSAIKGSLLILGTPGAGKTTTLLSLAQQLTKRELANIQQGSPKAMIPLIFELSTWRDDQQSIGDWLVAQLYENYGGDRKSRVYELWLEKQVLLPLLDGLDELGLVRQQKCTEQLNQFARTYPQLVVCCRVKEFRQVGVKLSNLRGAVQLEPLSDRQIASYLAAVGKSALWEQIQTVPEMHNLLQPVVDPENPDYDEPGLLRVPLFISLAARVFEADRPLIGKADLFDRYIDRQLSFDVRVSDRRKDVQKRDWAFKTVEREPDRRSVKHTMIWVAKQLKRQNQVDLLIEKMQPSWLGTEWRYRRLTTWLIFGPDNIKPVESFQASISHKVQQKIPNISIKIIFFGLSYGFLYGLLALIKRENPVQGMIYGLTHTLIVGLSVGIIAIPILGFQKNLKIRSKPNQGIWNSLQSMIWTSVFSCPISVFIATLITTSYRLKNAITLEEASGIILNSIWTSIIPGIFLAFFFGFLIGGGLPVIQHICLRIILTRHYQIPRNLARFLTYCHERRLLQQIGGRYRFIHRELLDHFAEL